MSDTEAADIKGTGKFSPFAGCLIMIIVGLLVIGFITFSWWSYTQVKATVEGFTETSPQEIAVIDVTGKESAQAELNDKLVSFKESIVAKETASISLSAADLNLAIASYEILKPNRQQTSITSISENGVEAVVSYPVNSGFGSDKKLYLNGNAAIIPEIKEGSVFPTVKTVSTPRGDDIPEEFKKFISETMLHPVRNDKDLGELLKRISSIEIVGDAIILKTEPDFVAAGQLPDNRKPILNRFMKGFAIVAVVFLFIVSLIIVLARRKTKPTI